MEPVELNIPNFKLENGNTIPAIGFGTFKADNMMLALHNSIHFAVQCGYRYIDSAWIYFINCVIRDALNEALVEVGKKVCRKDLFLSCKLWNIHHKCDMVRSGFEDSLANMGLDYFDLYLMESPMAFKENCGATPFPKDCSGNIIFSEIDYLETYKAMEEFAKKGLVKSLGVSNFNAEQLGNLLKNCEIRPQVNMIEVHPYFQNDKLVEFCKANKVMVIAYAPLAERKTAGSHEEIPDLFEEKILIKIANNHGKSVAQVCLRWLYQRGIVSVPRAIEPQHIVENGQIFDFELSDDEMKEIKKLNKNFRIHDLPELKFHKHYPFNEDFLKI